ncbi:MAG: hypothetical protein LBD81_01155 [Holosporaceae bacterium]|jgi:hypothetical protein|nr:hypothetical protein [Holosporaceae bacterium]
MKLDFKNIDDSIVKDGSVFYLYGNFKKAFGVFGDFLREKLICKYSAENVTAFSCSTVSDCLKNLRGQYSLFGGEVNFFTIRNVEDGHWEKLQPFLGTAGNVFLLESGDYSKSKKVTDCFVKSSFYAIPSFKSDQTLYSLCKMLLPTIPQSAVTELAKIIGNTDEDLRSFWIKVDLIAEDGSLKLLKEYAVHGVTFLQQLDFIPLIRYLQNLAIKERIYDRKTAGIPTIKFPENVMELLLNAELQQKYGSNLTKSYIYKAIAVASTTS